MCRDLTLKWLCVTLVSSFILFLANLVMVIILSCCSAPTWNDMYFVRWDAGDAGQVRLGLYGLSYRLADGDWIGTPSHLGLKTKDIPASLLALLDTSDGGNIIPYSTSVAMGIFHALALIIIVLPYGLMVLWTAIVVLLGLCLGNLTCDIQIGPHIQPSQDQIGNSGSNDTKTFHKRYILPLA